MDKTLALIEELSIEEDIAFSKTPKKIFGTNLVSLLNSAGFYKKTAWVGLTDDEVSLAWCQSKGDLFMRLLPFTRAIEAKLKEKNS